ncbi:haloacid dehalogenase [Clostridia bacterium]|nr:haloacid dehalogenase [Clostridia bacterium]
MTNIKLIVTDLDNTLLRRDKSVSEYTANVFKRCRERGILIAFATARFYRTIEEWLIPHIGIEPDIIISLNGAFAYKGQDTLYKATVSPETGNVLVAELKQSGGSVTIGTDSGFRYCERKIESTHASFSVLYDGQTLIDEEFHYVDVRGIAFSHIEQIAKQFPELRYQTYSDVDLVTFLRGNAEKHLALSAVLKSQNISAKEAVAFGDDLNDIEILRECGIGVAVANALNEVKVFAKYTCGDCDEDGVARWIEENML